MSTQTLFFIGETAGMYQRPFTGSIIAADSKNQAIEKYLRHNTLSHMNMLTTSEVGYRERSPSGHASLYYTVAQGKPEDFSEGFVRLKDYWDQQSQSVPVRNGTSSLNELVNKADIQLKIE